MMDCDDVVFEVGRPTLKVGDTTSWGWVLDSIEKVS